MIFLIFPQNRKKTPDAVVTRSAHLQNRAAIELASILVQRAILVQELQSVWLKIIELSAPAQLVWSVIHSSIAIVKL